MASCGAAALWVWREPLELSRLERGPVDALEAYARAEPSSRARTLALGRAYLRSDRATEAVALLDPWVGQLPGDPDARVLLAEGLLKSGQPGPAYGHLQMVLTQLRPGDPDAQWWLGQLEERRGDLHAAQEQYELVLRQRPKDERALMRLGTVAMGENRATAAEEFFRRAATANPNSAAAHAALGDSLLRQGRPAEAMESSRKAVALDGVHARAWLTLARSVRAIEPVNGVGEATEAFRNAIQSSPDSPTRVEARFHLAVMLRDQGEAGEAVKLLTENTLENPLHQASFYELAVAARMAGQPRVAESAIRRFEVLERAQRTAGALEARLSVEPGNVDLQLRLAAVYIETGRPDLARPLVDRILARNPGHATAQALADRIAARPEPSL